MSTISPDSEAAAADLHQSRQTKYGLPMAALTNDQYSKQGIHTLLQDPQLTDTDIRQLFGILRKRFLDVVWDYKQLELWVKRARHFGIEYTKYVSEERAGGSRGLATFYREQDEHLRTGGNGREWIVVEILQHVQSHRDAVETRRIRRARKEEIVCAGEEVVWQGA